MAWTPDPHLIGKSTALGLGNAKRLIDLVQTRQDRSALADIAQLAQKGDFNNAGSRLLEIGMVKPGLNTMNIPYSREQDAQKSKLAQLAFDANQNYRNAQLGMADRRLTQQNNLAQQRMGLQKSLADRDYNLQREKFEAKHNNTTPDVKGEQNIRKEFQNVTKDFRSVRDAYARVNASAKNPSPAGDMALIFNYMKILDPGSVVRESEFALAAQSGHYGDQIRTLVGRVLTGERLSANMRADFVSRAQTLFNERSTQYQQTSQEFKNLASQYNMDPDRVVLDYDRKSKKREVSGTTKSGLKWSLK